MVSRIALLLVLLLIVFLSRLVKSGNPVTLQQEVIFCLEKFLIKFQLFCLFVRQSFSLLYIPNTCRWLMSLHISFTAGSKLLVHLTTRSSFPVEHINVLLLADVPIVPGKNRRIKYHIERHERWRKLSLPNHITIYNNKTKVNHTVGPFQ